MTREEAREILTHNWTRVDNPNYSESELDEAFFMAIEALSDDTVLIHEDGTLEVKVPNAQKVGRVLVMDTDSHIGGGLFYPDDAVEVFRCKDCKHKYVSGNGTTQYYVCDFMDAQYQENGFCHHAEREAKE